MKKTDSELQRDVMAELEWDPSVDHSEIGVSAIDGVVTLSGFVGSYATKLAAERAARRVTGVNAIAMEIQVRLASDPKTADHEIARRIRDMLEWNTLVPDERIQVKVEKGWVTLTGDVAWHYQSDEAREAVSRVSGVTGVANNIRINATPTVPDLRKRIEEAFDRQADLDAAGVTIRMDSGKVILGGRVRAPYERRVAEQAVWGAPGVVQVDDRIMVSP